MKPHLGHLFWTVVFCFVGLAVQAQKGQTVTGVVVDEQRMGLPGASIVEKGTTNGVTTDSEGRYSLTLTSDNATIEYSFIGYTPQQEIVGRRLEINIQLMPVATELNEVVVVGYGQQKKASIVGAISSVDATSIANTSKVRLSQSLAGNISGIIAVQRSGELGNDHADFWIRGINTFAGASDPLIIVDGVERDFNSIDPIEIESFSVMKDASATAVYGVRGANGVIVITTKKGDIGAPKVSVNMEYAVKQPTRLPQFVDAVDFMKIANEANRRTGHNETFLPERINNTILKTDPDLYPNVNWVDELLKPVSMHERINVNISGGAPRVRYFISGTYHHENGLYRTDTDREWDANIGMDRVNFRSNLDADITKTTTVNLNIGSQLSINRGPNASSDKIWRLMLEIPSYFIPVRYSDGRLSAYGAGSEKGLNPYNRLTQSGYSKSTTNTLNSTISLTQKLDMITPGLQAKAMFAYDVWTGHYFQASFSPELWYATARDDQGQLNYVQAEKGEEFLKKSVWSDMSYTTYFEGTISYDRTFGDHKATAMLLYNQRVYNTNSGEGEYSVLPFKNLGLAGRATYSYKDRYFAEFNFGYNGSENFAPGKRFGFFPAVALGWYISEEPFWENIRPYVSKLKIRGSYGTVGNDKLGDNVRFAYITEIIDNGMYDFGLPGSSNILYGVTEGKFGSKDLTWETETKRDIGLEIGLFNMLELNVDYFFNNRRDIFMQRRVIPSTAGYNEAPWVNYGKMQNRGVDASLTLHKAIGKDWHIDAIGTFTFARNKVTEWDEPTQQYANLYQTGHSYGQQFGLVAERLYTDADFDASNQLLPQLPRPQFGLDVQPGDIKYVDINGDGVINKDDYTAIGYGESPEIVYGLGVNVRYKGLELGVRLQGTALTTRMINDVNFLPFARGMQKGNLYARVINDRWTEENPSQDVFFPRMRDYMDGHNYLPSTWWQKDMSFLRIKDIVLSYTLPQKTARKMGMSSMRIYGIVNNAWTFSSFKLWDPELGTNNGMRYPIMRTYNLGVELTF